MGHRYYSPGTGRFLTRDPKGYGGGVNLYGFTGNNPVNQQDPDGTDYGDYLLGIGDSLNPVNIAKGTVALGRYLVSGHASASALGHAFIQSINPTDPDIDDREMGRRAANLVGVVVAASKTAGAVASRIGTAGEASHALSTSAIPDSYINKEYTVDMRAAPASSGINAAGYPRNGPWFWRQMLANHPELFDTTNATRIRAGRSPIVNRGWIAKNPNHAGLLDQRLIHHHIDQGPIATPLPESIHKAWHGILHPN